MTSSIETRPVDAQTHAARAPRRARADRWSGVLLALLMLAAVGVAGRRIWAVATGPTPPQPGFVAPVLAAKTPAGQAIDLTAHRGDVVLVDFWATWCPPCVASMPHLQEAQETYGPKGFTVLGVNQEPGQPEHVARFMRQRGLTFETVLDEGDLAPRWGVYVFPTSFLLGRDGVIREVYRGPASKARLTKDIEAALADGDATSS